MVKTNVRELARDLGLPVADRMTARRFALCRTATMRVSLTPIFVKQGIEPQKTRGEIVSTDGRVLGEHGGTHHFTVGQRRGLRIAAAEPLYVIETDPAAQRVVVGGTSRLLRRS